MPQSHDNDNDNGNNDALYVLVTAHPDDESMFFIPTLSSLLARTTTRTQTNHNIHCLCLSNGDYDGLGKIRELELKDAWVHVLGLSPTTQQVADLEDGPNHHWSPSRVATWIQDYLDSILLQTTTTTKSTIKRVVLLTFDHGGVSHHVNHTDTYLGVQYFLSLHRASNVIVEAWQLDTIRNPILKYIPILDWMILLWTWMLSLFLSSSSLSMKSSLFPPFQGPFTKRQDNINSNMVRLQVFTPFLVWRAMAAHSSQFVWYRRLSVVFSRYSYVNDWRQMNPIARSSSISNTRTSGSSSNNTESAIEKSSLHLKTH